MDHVWQEWADARIKKHDKDLYEGNGKPPITVSIDRFERATRTMNAVMLLLIGAILTGIVDIAVRAVK